jgi:hypothetical protein
MGRVGETESAPVVLSSASDKTRCGVEMGLSVFSILGRFDGNKTSNAVMQNADLDMVKTLTI